MLWFSSSETTGSPAKGCLETHCCRPARHISQTLEPSKTRKRSEVERGLVPPCNRIQLAVRVLHGFPSCVTGPATSKRGSVRRSSTAAGAPKRARVKQGCELGCQSGDQVVSHAPSASACSEAGLLPIFTGTNWGMCQPACACTHLTPGVHGSYLWQAPHLFICCPWLTTRQCVSLRLTCHKKRLHKFFRVREDLDPEMCSCSGPRTDTILRMWEKRISRVLCETCRHACRCMCKQIHTVAVRMTPACV